ncbi:MAG: C39 family peptidase [Armatimonadetes bacterium]|nr:C39 family peptidase [Armatimonadota bacterium]
MRGIIGIREFREGDVIVEQIGASLSPASLSQFGSGTRTIFRRTSIPPESAGDSWERTYSRPIAFPKLRDMHLLPVPDTRQTTDYTCGPSALQAVLMYWGKEHLEPDLAEMLHTDPLQGTNPKDMVRVSRELGFEADLKENLTIEDLEASIAQGVPVIVAAQAWREGADLDKPWLEVWDSGHYMVVIGTDAKNVYFEDPSIFGSRGYLSREEFLERWHDQDDRKYYHSGIFVRGAAPAPPPSFIYIE